MVGKVCNVRLIRNQSSCTHQKIGCQSCTWQICFKQSSGGYTNGCKKRDKSKFGTWLEASEYSSQSWPLYCIQNNLHQLTNPVSALPTICWCSPFQSKHNHEEGSKILDESRVLVRVGNPLPDLLRVGKRSSQLQRQFPKKKKDQSRNPKRKVLTRNRVEHASPRRRW